MIYLNNAATTYPKPQCVCEAHAAALKNPPSSQFRSADSFNKKIFMICVEIILESYWGFRIRNVSFFPVEQRIL